MRILLLLILIVPLNTNAQMPCDCPQEYKPVCSVKGNTFDNACLAACNQEEIFYEGECLAEEIELIQLNYYKGWHSTASFNYSDSVEVFRINDSLKGISNFFTGPPFKVLSYFVREEKNYEEAVLIKINPINREPFYKQYVYKVYEGENPANEFCHASQTPWIKSITDRGGQCFNSGIKEINWYDANFYFTYDGFYFPDVCAFNLCPSGERIQEYFDIFGNTISSSGQLGNPFALYTGIISAPNEYVWSYKTDFFNLPNFLEDSLVQEMIVDICITDIYSIKHNNFTLIYGLSNCNGISNQIFNFGKLNTSEGKFYQQVFCPSLEKEIQNALTSKNLIWSNNPLVPNCRGIIVENINSYCENCELKISFDVVANDSIYTAFINDSLIIKSGSTIPQGIFTLNCLDFYLETISGCKRHIKTQLPVSRCCENSFVCNMIDAISYSCAEGLILNGENKEKCKNLEIKNFYTDESFEYGDELIDTNYLFYAIDSIEVMQDSIIIKVADTSFFNLKVDCDSTKVGIDNFYLEELLFKIYPNPVTNYLFIRPNNLNSSTYKIKLFNSDGKQVELPIKKEITKQVFQLNLQSLNKGIYFLQFSNEHFQTTEKIVKL